MNRVSPSHPLRLKGWLNSNERGLSPLVGIVILIGIIVILNATAAFFIFNIGNDFGRNTQAQVEFSYINNDAGDGDGLDGDLLSFTHRGGDTLNTSTVVINYTNVTDGGSSDTTEYITPPDGEFKLSDLDGTNTFTEGDTVVLGNQSKNVHFDEATVTVRYDGEAGEQILGVWNGPDA